MLTKNQILKLAAIFSLMSLLGACASTGGNGTPQYPLEKLGKSVTETGNRIWDGTRYLFKLKDSDCLLYTSPSPRDKRQSRMPSSA